MLCRPKWIQLTCTCISVFVIVSYFIYFSFPSNARLENSKFNVDRHVNIHAWYHIPTDDFKTCIALINHNVSVINEIRSAQWKKRAKLLRNISEILPSKREDCSTFLDRRGYWTKEVSQEENQFPIAFSILVYTNLDQVERLVRAIYRPNNIYCIHVDLKATNTFREALVKIISCLPNVFLCSKSENVKWGMFSIVQAELNCWNDLLQSKVAWRYLINLTGKEFPLKTNLQLVKILKALNGTNNIDGRDKQ